MKCMSITMNISIKAEQQQQKKTDREDYMFQNIWEKIFLCAIKNIPKCFML